SITSTGEADAGARRCVVAGVVAAACSDTFEAVALGVSSLLKWGCAGWHSVTEKQSRSVNRRANNGKSIVGEYDRQVDVKYVCFMTRKAKQQARKQAKQQQTTSLLQETNGER